MQALRTAHYTVTSSSPQSGAVDLAADPSGSGTGSTTALAPGILRRSSAFGLVANDAEFHCICKFFWFKLVSQLEIRRLPGLWCVPEFRELYKSSRFQVFFEPTFRFLWNRLKMWTFFRTIFWLVWGERSADFGFSNLKIRRRKKLENSRAKLTIRSDPMRRCSRKCKLLCSFSFHQSGNSNFHFRPAIIQWISVLVNQ